MKLKLTLKLNKKELQNLSKNTQILSKEMTAAIGGGSKSGVYIPTKSAACN